MVGLCRAIANSSRFQNFIIMIILAAGVLVGIETYPSIVEAHGPLLHSLDAVVLAIFSVEILIKMIANWPRPHHFFKDGWNCFDFVIVVAAFLPFGGPAATVLRLLRLLRVLRLLRAVPKLQLLVGALLKSIPSMGYVSVLLGMLFYIYAVSGVFLWGTNDPVHFGNLQAAMVSLFRVVTLEDWTDLMYTAMYGCADRPFGMFDQLCESPSASPIGGAVYFISFVLFGTMIVLNLFIGVILNGMTETQKETEAELELRRQQQGLAPSLPGEIDSLQRKLLEVNDQLSRVQRLARLDITQP